MKIQVTGNINEYYVQTLCMLFFPGVKFSKTEAAESDGLSVEIVVRTKELGAEATVSLHTEKGTAVYTHYEEGKIGSKVSVEQIACGKAFFEAGKKLTGITPSWGILTGVRPAKLAIAGLMNGKSKKEVRDFLTSEYLVSPKKASLVTEIASIENDLLAKANRSACSLYITIPFCPSRCSYCSFVSHSVDKAQKLIPQYVELLCREIEETGKIAADLGLKLSTVYIGGGTPTTLSAEQLDVVMKTVSKNFDTSGLLEYTVEAGRPDTITAEKLKAAVDGGVNRISVNPQTLNDTVPKALGQNSRGLKPRENLGFLKHTTMPAVILESFFLDNDKDNDIGDTVAEQRAFGVAYVFISSFPT